MVERGGDGGRTCGRRGVDGRVFEQLERDSGRGRGGRTVGWGEQCAEIVVVAESRVR